MKQILQSLKTGKTEIADIPCPQLKSGHLLIQTDQSLISSGTEKMLVDFGKGSLLDKARQQPEKVKMVFDKIKTDGLVPTISAVRHKLDQLLPMGYCNIGTVIKLGEGVNEFSIGDRVISNGHHAEIITVAKNLCCKVPENVSSEEAVFTVLGAVALQGMRLAQPTLGENFVVIGLGLIGLLTVQLLQAQGCRVLAVDLDQDKNKLAAQFGAAILAAGEDLLSTASAFSRQRGIDGVIITASTQSNEPIHQAAKICRKRGRIILVGVTGLELSRADFYEKELCFQVSCSYGPGRYDPAFEEQGYDYPIGYVRWTEQRNFEAFLDMLASKKITVQPLISHRFPIAQADSAYALLSSKTKSLGILINYPALSEGAVHLPYLSLHTNEVSENKVEVGFIGAGNYAGRVLIPAFAKTSAVLKTIACSKGISGTQLGKKFRFAAVTTEVEILFNDKKINTLVIATRHNDHAELVCRGLEAGKHIFVEKPLCINFAELITISEIAKKNSATILMVGFNRRFAPHIQKIKTLLNPIHEPKAFIMTVNAGEIPSDHWTQNKKIGGGRIIGEACHFIDLLRYLAGAAIESFHMMHLKNTNCADDKLSIQLAFADGSIGTIHYLANGHRRFPKERLEVFVSGRILQLDNFRKLRGYGWKQFNKMNLWRQNKGQLHCVQQFISAIEHGLPAPISLNEILEVSRVTLEIAEASN